MICPQVALLLLNNLLMVNDLVDIYTVCALLSAAVWIIFTGCISCRINWSITNLEVKDFLQILSTTAAVVHFFTREMDSCFC